MDILRDLGRQQEILWKGGKLVRLLPASGFCYPTVYLTK